MIERADKIIQHAETQENTAYKAKRQAYKDLQKSIHRRYGEDLLDHYKIRNYALEIRPSYESTNIDLYLNIRLEEKYEKVLEEIREKMGDEAFRVSWNYKKAIEEEIHERFFEDLDLETRIHIKVKTEEEFERLRK